MKPALFVLFLSCTTVGNLGALEGFKGSADLGADLTFWSLDDSFSASLIEMETTRTAPVFYRFNLELEDLFGLKAGLGLYLDQILAPLNLFVPDFSVGLSGTSGGARTDIYLPWNVLEILGELIEEDFTGSTLYPEIHYRYRLFRWDNKIVDKWLDPTVDYYDEDGARQLFALGDSFSTGSQWHNLWFGLGGSLFEDMPMKLFLGLEWSSLLAPTLLGLEIRDSYALPGAEVVMMTRNNFLGVRTTFTLGIDAYNPEEIPEDDLGLGFTMGMSLGSFQGSNEYFEGPGSLGYTMVGSVQTGWQFEPWEGAQGWILLGLEGTFSLMATFGSADAPGKALKDIDYHAIGGTYTIPAGAELDVTISRWENYGGPFLKAGLRF